MDQGGLQLSPPRPLRTISGPRGSFRAVTSTVPGRFGGGKPARQDAGGHLDLPAGDHRVTIVAITESERSPGATALRVGTHDRRLRSPAIASGDLGRGLAMCSRGTVEAEAVL